MIDSNGESDAYTRNSPLGSGHSAIKSPHPVRGSDPGRFLTKQRALRKTIRFRILQGFHFNEVAFQSSRQDTLFLSFALPIRD
ncbi:hypothetical protein NPIL_291611 [Nephila pilipes]|uniref:Uncharacterized protein n=1 Tax=Nephila pilipes TaxID=299642 RepID=A0A8X6T6W1_NEPPI|nr:hypothetical protein NPIL_291611 [Nephila pilipes]